MADTENAQLLTHGEYVTNLWDSPTPFTPVRPAEAEQRSGSRFRQRTT
jgi:hypothetical protein